MSDRARVAEVWPAVTVMVDPGARWTLDEARLHLPERRVPQVPHSNFGERRDAVWLVWDVDLKPSGRGLWLLDVAYSALDEVDLHVLRDGQPLREAHQRAGDGRPMSWRAMPARTHVLPLDLAPGRYTLLLRVATTGGLITPMQLLTPEQYSQREYRVQLVQGLSSGIVLCLLFYSLAQWASLRDGMFAFYSLSISGLGLFLFSFNGLGLQHLWGEHVRVSAVLSPACVLLSGAGAFLFIDRVLDIRALSRRMSRVMQVGAVAAVVSVALLLVDVFGYREGQQASKVLGQLPMFLALPFAWRRWRQGDRAAAYMFIGWAVYAVGGLTTALLLAGHVAATPVTLNALQAASLVEMVMWLVVMGMRVEQLRWAAEQATRDGDHLRHLAETDALTGLLNRRGLQAAVTPLLDRLRPGRLLAVYLVDLDGFKQINDLRGHEVGDRVLVEVGLRLCAQVRDVDLVSRTGGDEFVLLVGDLPDDAAAERIGEDLMQALEAPMVLGTHVCRVGATIGYALAPMDGLDMAGLLRRADRAMYLGKQAGKRQVRRLAQGE
ncbi:diguanylate cyclase [Sphaerotilus sp.]|uniref:diguanylate cyclase n=1 Tax=Sphaerotilus sp. TaxID=2093942 RepID=UPI002ACF0496|nr:diguanylate cyclase [Sphaerotilus sp.]MDZ7856653.1 diguanylate cyclase [Sphaerotilus sp.]